MIYIVSLGGGGLGCCSLLKVYIAYIGFVVGKKIIDYLCNKNNNLKYKEYEQIKRWYSHHKQQ